MPRVATILLVSSVAILSSLVAAYVMLLPGNQPAPSPSATIDAKSATAPEKPPAAEKPADISAVEKATSTVEALTKTLAPPASKPAGNPDDGPVFDVARISPTGEAVIAGRAKPGASVELLRDGVVHDKTVAEKSGEFVFVPSPLPAGEYSLSLRATLPDGTVATSKKSVAVALHADKTTKQAAAPPTPAKPVDQKPAGTVANVDARNAKSAGVRIVAVESRGSGKLTVTGQSDPGATVRLSLNGSYVASAIASASGDVTFAIESGVVPGDYRVQLDLLDGASVRAHAEQAFKAPATNAATSVAAAEPPKSNPNGPAADAAPAKPKPMAPSMVAAPKDAGPSASQAPQPEPLPGAPKPAAPETAASGNAIADAVPNKGVPAADQNAPAAKQQVTETPQQSSTPSSEAKNVVVVPSIDTAAVRRGDNLWGISRSTYGQGIQYPKIFDANRDQIRDPDLIYPGQIFVLPKAAAGE